MSIKKNICVYLCMLGTFYRYYYWQIVGVYPHISWLWISKSKTHRKWDSV